MSTRSVITGRWLAGAALILAIGSATAQVGAVLAASSDQLADSLVAQALPTPTPFRFLTPTPFVPRTTTTTGVTGTTSTTTATTAPRAGGFPLELAFPVLAGGLAAIGGGTLVLRRKTTR
jgi:hypothetical protein